MPTSSTHSTRSKNSKSKLRPADASEPLQLHSQALALALIAREEYFAALSPDVREEALAFQEIIDDRLAKAGSLHNRMVVLSEMMRGNQLLMVREIKELRSLCLNLCEKIKEL